METGTFEALLAGIVPMVEGRDGFGIHDCHEDGTFSKAKGGGVGAGRTKAGKGVKTIIRVDANGLPMTVNTDSASPHESSLAKPPFDFMATSDFTEKSIGDKPYDSDELDQVPGARRGERDGFRIEAMPEAPHSDPPSVPPPAPGSAAEKARNVCARIWYARGFWWFRSAHDGVVREMSSVMRRTRYDTQALAHALGLGERTFCRLVRDEIGHPVGYWLRSLRAVEFLHRIKTGESIRNLSQYYGYRHQTDFSAEFKRWHGVSPAVYRRNHSAQAQRAVNFRTKRKH